MTLEFYQWEFASLNRGGSNSFDYYRFRPGSPARTLTARFKNWRFMKTRHQTAFQAGYALLTVLIFASVSILILATTLSWTSGSSRVTERNNAYNRAVSAAEASVESVIARMDRDFLNHSIDYNNLTPYRLTVPTTYMPTGWPLDYHSPIPTTSSTIPPSSAASKAFKPMSIPSFQDSTGLSFRPALLPLPNTSARPVTMSPPASSRIFHSSSSHFSI